MQIFNLFPPNNSFSKKSKDKEGKKGKEKKQYGPFFISAELNHRNYDLIQSGQMSVVIPKGVSMKNRAGSRVLDFTCDDHEIAKVLVEALDDCGIPWDEKSDNKEVSLDEVLKMCENE